MLQLHSSFKGSALLICISPQTITLALNWWHWNLW